MFAAVTASAYLNICMHSLFLVEGRRGTGEEYDVFTISGSLNEPQMISSGPTATGSFDESHESCTTCFSSFICHPQMLLCIFFNETRTAWSLLKPGACFILPSDIMLGYNLILKCPSWSMPSHTAGILATPLESCCMANRTKDWLNSYNFYLIQYWNMKMIKKNKYNSSIL